MFVDNIPQLKRKEQSAYRPSDLWTLEDDLLFLKYCPSIRDKCYHMISMDTGCRPHEILKLKIKDVVFKTTTAGEGNRQYAEALVNGKTGSIHIPLINSIPYVKHWLDQHPHQGNPNAPLICGYGKSLGRRQRPNCSEPNKPDSKFCAKCRMVLTYDAYSETLESEKQKEDKTNNYGKAIQCNAITDTITNFCIFKYVGSDSG